MSERHEEALALLHDICDLFGIGADARSRDVILTNVQNAKRRSECLNRVEWEFFTTTETDEDGWEYEECPLNWGANSQEYAEQLRAALSRIEAETEARVLESLKREPDGYAYSYPSPFGGEVIRFSNGEEYNGHKPLCAVPYWLGEPATKNLPTSPKSVEGMKARHLTEREQYGNDGERHCNTCWIDFNKDSAAEIERKIWEYNMRKLAVQQALSPTTPTADEKQEQL